MLSRSAVALGRRAGKGGYGVIGENVKSAAAGGYGITNAAGLRRTFGHLGARYADNDHHPAHKIPVGSKEQWQDQPAALTPLDKIHSKADLLPPGAPVGPEMPSDLDQATGLERLELLGKMQGIDVFDLRPLDASRLGTLDDPIIVKSAGDEQLAGCTGFPADSHWVIWLGLSRERPMERCKECGSVYKMEYIGPPDDPHGHGDHGHGHGGHEYKKYWKGQRSFHEVGPAEDTPDLLEPVNFSQFVRPEYRGAPEGFKHPEKI